MEGGEVSGAIQGTCPPSSPSGAQRSRRGEEAHTAHLHSGSRREHIEPSLLPHFHTDCTKKLQQEDFPPQEQEFLLGHSSSSARSFSMAAGALGRHLGTRMGLLWALLTLLNHVGAFNLDTTHTLHKLGDRGTFFGFSLALHQQLTPEPQSWILVGAPQAAGHGLLRGSRPGALFKCPITPEEYDCERVDIDGTVSLNKENKDNQWLGVTVKSQGIGGKVVTCAHLYELRQRVHQPTETRSPIGRCYVLSEDLTKRDDLDGGEWKFCEGRPQGHEQFGFCQQGLSVSFTPDNNFILFGAPGTYHWKGEVRMQLLNQTLLDLGVYDDGPYEVADQKELNARLIPVPYHSYLGFSVDSAMGIMSLGELTFVAGAPRANHTGAVVLLRKDNVHRLVPEHIFWGEELASSFGYSVATTDLNNDGWTDLIVGAPNFFDRKAEIGGAVYVYLNPFGHWDDQARPIRLNGTYDSMFGMTVSNIGDLDQDGYGDIAVGAPFDGDGKVFIYRGSDAGIETKPAQVLDGQDFDVRRFGYSISGGLDVDENHYPDLAIGSLNNSVVLFRSRPVIHVIREISIDPEYIDLTQHNCKGRDGVCIEVKACFVYAAHPVHYSPHITLMVRFEADAERRKLGLPHRVNFLGRSSLESEYTQIEEVELHRQKHPACATATFQLHENIRDKLRPISLAITHTIKPVPPHRHSGAKRLERLAPVLNVSPSNTLHSEVNFLREGCGPDKICQSNLQLSYRFGTRPLTSDLFTPLPRDENDVQVFSLSDQRVVALEITVTNMPSDPLRPEEDGDDAHAAQLLVSLPRMLSYAGSRVPAQMRCQANQNGSDVECDLGNPVKRNTKLKFTINLSTANITIETTELTADLQLTTISEQPDLVQITAMAKVVIELPLSVSGLARPHQLFFSGAVRGESAMSSLEDVGSPVDFEFVVANPGQALQTFGSAFLNIMWPYELDNGKWLLYPASLNFDGSQCTPVGAINPLSLDAPASAQPVNQTVGRTRRSHPDLEGQETTGGSVKRSAPAVAASERRKSLKLDCLLGSARCMLLQCPLHSFSGQAVLRIHGRLWNSTFIEEFPAVSALELLVRAEITVKSTIKHLLLRDAEAQVSVMIYPEPGLVDQYSIPWWIILIAILAGIFLLTLLVCLLWMCGFFQRAHHKEKLPQYHAVKIPRQERPQFQTEKSGVHKKEWATHWNDGTS
ncbi:integrin alpha-7 isoform X3 [Syngnathus acus]|uniref:integrin alpha-7 isoform X3 n=1 Tax=Syngnathus acus TaxID=161584 RepID=UPI0018860F7E|nr:integrin alpha-7 isoform X3 [Syngnathus acus]